MKIKYSEDTDILLIKLREGTPVDSVDLREGIIVHLNAQGEPLEIELLDASKLTNIEEVGVSLPKPSAASI